MKRRRLSLKDDRVERCLKRAEAESNRGPSAYQSNAVPLGQTGSRQSRLTKQSFMRADIGLSPLRLCVCVCVSSKVVVRGHRPSQLMKH